MRRLALVAALAACHSTTTPTGPRPITIERDDWGIAHVHGATDADAVFGMIYAQAEDDFPRIERNYLVALGRLAEIDGETAVASDVRARMFLDHDELRREYAASPPWLRALMDAWAEGLNHFLATHPNVKPRAITTFEPWMALSFTEGSIGADLERVELALDDVKGSNGIAIAPKLARDHHALLLVNPHTSFYFRSEIHVTSDEGLDAYGAVTWGQFFIYQGFNARVGWMHTSSGVDAVDEWTETIVRDGEKLRYRHGEALRPVEVHPITISVNGTPRTITTYRTHHGPVVKTGDHWIATNLMVKPIAALSQSYLRTKAKNLAGFREVMALRANSTNNTIYADADGHIAYFHPQFIPRRDDRFDWTKPVDGSDPATDWKGEHGAEDGPHVIDPPIGWVMNTNDHPYSAAGPDSPKRDGQPRYMDTFGETPRGWHALRVLAGAKDMTIDSLRDAAFDPYLTAFEKLVPLLRDMPEPYAEPLAMLRAWDLRWSATSIPTTLAVSWGMALLAHAPDPGSVRVNIVDRFASTAPPEILAAAWREAIDSLVRDFGTWRVPWGDINRFQRPVNDQFDDNAPSIGVPFTAGMWGSLASFGVTRPKTKKLYGVLGNSFVAVVEFGPRVRAKAILVSGAGQAERYASGNLRDVYFYPDERAKHIVRRYTLVRGTVRP